MSPIDKKITYLLHLITGLPKEDIYNYYDIRGANPEKVVVNSDGVREIRPYSPYTDTFVIFGVEDIEDGQEGFIVTPGMGGPEGEIFLTHKYKVGIEFNGKLAPDLALQFKALMWRWDVMEYFENNKISVKTQNPEIQFMNEVVNEEMWERRGLSFEVVAEFAYKDKEQPEITEVSNTIVTSVDKIQQQN